MPAPAFVGTYPLAGVTGATVTAGGEYAVEWCNRYLSRPVDIAVDIETVGVGYPDGVRVKCVTVAVPEAALVLDPRDWHQALLIRQIVAYAPRLVMHNGSFDSRGLIFNGLMTVADIAKVHDTLVCARIATPGDLPLKDLDSCCVRYLAMTSAKITDLFKVMGYTKSQGFELLDIDAPAYLMGAASDGVATIRLAPVVWRAAVDQLAIGHPYQDVGLDGHQAAALVEKLQIVNRWAIRRTVKGIAVDLDFLDSYEYRTRGQLERQESQLQRLGITPGNGNHLTRWLSDQGALPYDFPLTKTGKLSAAAPALEALQHPVAQAFVEAKKVRKLLDDYLIKCRTTAAGDGRIHPTTHVAKAAHGRDSMSDPPLHQFPPGARGIVLPDEGHEFGSTDWTAQEPRIMLNVAGDTAALEAYERGERIYTPIAAAGNITDKQAKVVLLAGMYGQGKRLLSDNLGMPYDPWLPAQGAMPERWGFAAATELQRAAFSSIPRSWELLQRLRGMARMNGSVYTVGGRILPIPMGKGFDGGPPGRQTHKGPNFMISGSGKDELTDVIVTADQQGWSDHLYFGMHDELIHNWEVREIVRKTMETPSERFCWLSRRTPVIRTDQNFLGERWKYS